MRALGSVAKGQKSLVIVCCHAIYLLEASASQPEAVNDENNWLLAEFQRSQPGKEGEHVTFLKHIDRAHEIARDLSPNVNVIFSGGVTKRETPKSEAQSYLDALLTTASSASQKPAFDPSASCLLEEKATDSFQNILFSILRHFQIEKSWPSYITIVTHKFKTERIRYHLQALKWPEDKFRVEGIDPPFSAEERRGVERFEQRCLDEWKADLYGTRAPLCDKRIQRLWQPSSNLFNRMTSDASVRRLLEWDGGNDSSSIFPHHLPWE